jgi:sRNA-binding regulator protein Hfq
MKKISIVIMNENVIDQVLNLEKVKSIDVTDYRTSTDLNITLLNGVELQISIKEKNYQLIIEKEGGEDEA